MRAPDHFPPWWYTSDMSDLIVPPTQASPAYPDVTYDPENPKPVGFRSTTKESIMIKFHFYVDSKGEHRWKAVAENGRIVADGSEGYIAEDDAHHGLNVIIDAIYKGHFEIARDNK